MEIKVLGKLYSERFRKSQGFYEKKCRKLNSGNQGQEDETEEKDDMEKHN